MTAQQNTGAAYRAAFREARPLPTHRMRRTDYWPTHHNGALWMGVCRSKAKVQHGACWIFTDTKTGATQHASVEGITATHWLLLLGRTDDLCKVTRAWQPCRMGLEVRLRVPKAEGAANAPAALKLQELAFGRQVCKRNDDVVPSLLKGGPARVDRISRGMALNQGPAASWLG